MVNYYEADYYVIESLVDSIPEPEVGADTRIIGHDALEEVLLNAYMIGMCLKGNRCVKRMSRSADPIQAAWDLHGEVYSKIDHYVIISILDNLPEPHFGEDVRRVEINCLCNTVAIAYYIGMLQAIKKAA